MISVDISVGASVDISVDASVDMSVATRSSIDRVSKSRGVPHIRVQKKKRRYHKSIYTSCTAMSLSTG